MSSDDLFDNEFDLFVDRYPYRNSKPMSLERLVECILDLEKNGVIAFDEFKELKYKVIQQEYFGMVTETQMRKAIIKIQDSREGKTGLSSFTTVTETYRNGKVKVEQKTDFF